MISADSLRDFVNERLTAAAEEIFGVFQRAIVDYEEEISRQRRLLDVIWKPEIQIQRIEPPQQHVCQKEVVLTEWQLCNQERNSSLDQEDPELPQIKEEQEEVCIKQEEEQLVFKKEANDFMTPIDEEIDTDQMLDLNPDDKESPVDVPVVGSMVSNSNGALQLLSDSSYVSEIKTEKGDKLENSPEEQHYSQDHKSTCQIKSTQRATMVENHCSTDTGKKIYTCDTCGRDFKFKSDLKTHLRIHTGEKPYACKLCRQIFRHRSVLKRHLRSHSDDKPYACETCGKRFTHNYNLTLHVKRMHTGDKSHVCQTCGKGYALKSSLSVHVKRSHSGERPYVCKTCGKSFAVKNILSVHMRIHTGEKPFPCLTCGKEFRYSNDLTTHMRRAHTGERPFFCNVCGKRFFRMSDLNTHKKSHAAHD